MTFPHHPSHLLGSAGLPNLVPTTSLLALIGTGMVERLGYPGRACPYHGNRMIGDRLPPTSSNSVPCFKKNTSPASNSLPDDIPQQPAWRPSGLRFDHCPETGENRPNLPTVRAPRQPRSPVRHESAESSRQSHPWTIDIRRPVPLPWHCAGWGPIETPKPPELRGVGTSGGCRNSGPICTIRSSRGCRGRVSSVRVERRRRTAWCDVRSRRLMRSRCEHERLSGLYCVFRIPGPVKRKP